MECDFNEREILTRSKNFYQKFHVWNYPDLNSWSDYFLASTITEEYGEVPCLGEAIYAGTNKTNYKAVNYNKFQMIQDDFPVILNMKDHPFETGKYYDSVYFPSGRCFWSMHGVEYISYEFTIYSFRHFRDQCEDCCDFLGENLDLQENGRCEPCVK